MKAIVSLSGGMDSATVLAKAIASEREVEAVGFFYDSKHNEYENWAAKRLADHYGVSLAMVDLSEVSKHIQSNLLIGGGEIPEGHYEDETMAQTVVPGRNLIFVSVLTGIAWTSGASEIWIGIHSGDHAIYPDCRPEFFDAMGRAVELGSDGRVRLVAPFLHGNKATILQEGFQLQVPYELTRTCYKQQELACGKCGACQERLEAFRVVGQVDPVVYEQ